MARWSELANLHRERVVSRASFHPKTCAPDRGWIGTGQGILCCLASFIVTEHDLSNDQSGVLFVLEADELERRLNKIRELEGNLTFRFAIVNRILENQVLELVAPYKLNLTGYRVLRVTSIFEAISLSDLSRQMLIDRAQISRTAADLERRGLIEFRQDGDNKRKKMVVLSTDGNALMKELSPKFRARRERIDETIGKEALPEFWQAIEKLSNLRYAD